MWAWAAINVLVLVVVWQAVRLHQTRRATVSLAQCVLELGDDLTTLQEQVGADDSEYGWPTADQALAILDQIGTADDSTVGWETFERPAASPPAGCAICNHAECHCWGCPHEHDPSDCADCATDPSQSKENQPS